MDIASPMPYFSVMAKLARNGSTGRFSVTASGNGRQATVRETTTGKAFDLKGYGALSGQFTVRKGFDLSKPIAAQAAKRKTTKAIGNAPKSS